MDTNLFVQQRTVERIVQRLQSAFQVERAALGVVASPKSLVQGNIRIIYGTVSAEKEEPSFNNVTVPTPDSSRSNALVSRDPPPFMVPEDCMISHVEALGPICWILVVEKEAVFHTMVQHRLTVGITGQLGPGLLLTVCTLYPRK